jgi:hypothetical protein
VSFTSALPTKLPLFSGVVTRLYSSDSARGVEDFRIIVVWSDTAKGPEAFSLVLKASDSGMGYEAWTTTSVLMSSDYAKSTDVAMPKLLGLDSAKSLDALIARGLKLYDYAKSFELNVPVRQPIRTVSECLDLLSKILPEIDYKKEVSSYHFNYPYDCAKLAVDLLGKAIQRVVEKGLYRKRWGDVVALKDVVELYLEAQRFVDAYRILKTMDILTPDHENFLIEIIYDVWQALQVINWLVTPTISIKAEDWINVRAWLKPEVLYRISQIDIGRGAEKYLTYYREAIFAQSTLKLTDVALVGKAISFSVSDSLPLSSYATVSTGFIGRDSGSGAEVYRISIVVPIAPRSSISLVDAVSIVRTVSITVSDYLSLSSSASPSVLYTLRFSDRGAGAEAYSVRNLGSDVGTGREYYNISVKVNVFASSGISLADAVSARIAHSISVSESLIVSSTALPSVKVTKTSSDSGAGKEAYSISVKVSVFASSSIGLSDSAWATAKHTISVSDSLSLGSKALPSVKVTKTSSDSSKGSETYGVTKKEVITASSKVSLVDSTTITVARKLSASDSLSLSSSASVTVR